MRFDPNWGSVGGGAAVAHPGVAVVLLAGEGAGLAEFGVGPGATFGADEGREGVLQGGDDAFAVDVGVLPHAGDAFAEALGRNWTAEDAQVAVDGQVHRQGAVLDDGLALAVLGVAADLSAVDEHVVGGMSRAQVAGRRVDRWQVAVGVVGVETERVERGEQRLTERAVGVDQSTREVVGGGDDPVGDVGVGVVVDAAAAGLSSRDVDPRVGTERPVDGVGGLAVAQREDVGPGVDAHGADAVLDGPAGGDFLQGHCDGTGPALLGDEPPLPVAQVHARRRPLAGIWMSDLDAGGRSSDRGPPTYMCPPDGPSHMRRGDRRHRNVVDRRTLLKGAGALGTAGVVGLAGCAGGSDTVSIGMANSLTGSLDTFGERNQRGKQLALEDINEVGLRGGELEIVEEDTESQSGPGVSAAQRLVNQEDVPILVGAVSSSVSVAIYESVIQGTDVDQISQNSTSPDLTSFPELTRMSPPGRAQAGAIAQLVEDDGHNSVAVAYINNAYGQGVADVFREEFGGSVGYFQSHSQEQSSYSDVVTAMDGSDADAWVFVTYQPEFTTMGQEAFDRGYQPPVYGADSVTGPDVLDQVPDDFLEGMKAVVPSAAVTQDNYRNFAERFQEEFDTDPTSWATYCYDAIVTAALAIEASEEATAEGIANETVKEVTRPGGEEVFTYQEAHDVLSDGGAGDVNYQGISGPVELDESGDPEAFLQVLEVRDGEYVETGTIS